MSANNITSSASTAAGQIGGETKTAQQNVVAGHGQPLDNTSTTGDNRSRDSHIEFATIRPLNIIKVSKDPVQIDPRRLMEDVLEGASVFIKAAEVNGLKCCVYGDTADYVYGLTKTAIMEVHVMVWIQGEESRAIKETIKFLKGMLKNTRKDTFKMIGSDLIWMSKVDNEPTQEYKIIVHHGRGSLDIPEKRMIYAGKNDVPIFPILALILEKATSWTENLSNPDISAQYQVEIADLLNTADKRYHLKWVEADKWIGEPNLSKHLHSMFQYCRKFPDEGWQRWNSICKPHGPIAPP